MPLAKGAAVVVLSLALHHAHASQSARTDASGRPLVCDPVVAAEARPLDSRAAEERCPHPFTVIPEQP
jgi:hypothetical protein